MKCEGYFFIRVVVIMFICIKIFFYKGEFLFIFLKCFYKRLWVVIFNIEKVSGLDSS